GEANAGTERGEAGRNADRAVRLVENDGYVAAARAFIGTARGRCAGGGRIGDLRRVGASENCLLDVRNPGRLRLADGEQRGAQREFCARRALERAARCKRNVDWGLARGNYGFVREDLVAGAEGADRAVGGGDLDFAVGDRADYAADACASSPE